MMRICIVHNSYGKFSGEEAAVGAQREILEVHGHRVCLFQKDSTGLNRMFLGKSRAFFSGIYNARSRREIANLIREHHPNLVHIHNLYPWISPSILPECHAAGVPVVMTVHNYRLICPNGLHMPKGRHQICERCCGGREYWCVLRNCEREYFKSLGYALRTYAARRLRFFTDNVTLFVCLTDFQRRRLLAEGYPPGRLRVLPNMCPSSTNASSDAPDSGAFVGYVGRISPEKGMELLLAAAMRLPKIAFRLAGDHHTMRHLLQKSSDNVSFLGGLDKPALSEFYGQSRLLVLCSTCFEGFPMTILEAMVHNRPVVAPRIGGIPEIVDDGQTGLLFAPGNASELAEKIQYLWDRPNLCRQMGHSGRQKALREYSAERHYDSLLATYEEAIQLISTTARDRLKGAGVGCR